MLTDVLSVNPGSTSVKLSRRIAGRDISPPASLDAALRSGPAPAVIVYRVVHGGPRTTAEVLDDAVVAELRALTELAPLHQPAALDAIDRGRAAWPGATHIACFDTAFHTTLPPAARSYALPARLRARVRVYGFHGLSHAWATARAREAVPGARRILIAHLGGGQSLCGVRDGHSTVTTMGCTPLDGLVMATRCGALDPGALLYLAAHTDEDLAEVLGRESGLLGLAGTADMRQVLRRRHAGDPAAVLALDVWLHRFAREAGGCIAALGGLDALVFTGGIGENSAEIRTLIADRLGWLGVALRREAIVTDLATDVTAPGAAVRSLVVHAREDLQMIHEAERVLTRTGRPARVKDAAPVQVRAGPS